MKKIFRVGKAITAYPFRLEENIEIFVENNIIKSIYFAGSREIEKDTTIYDYTNLLVTPGFIQTHIHLCQTLFRGLADDMDLLEWLVKHIFPLEFGHNEESIKYSALLGIAEIIRSGTTTIMDMGTIHHEEVIIEAIKKSGLRAVVGKAMMDSNPLFPKLSESTKDAIQSSIDLAKLVQKDDTGRLSYAFTPRFILSCTDELLITAFNLTNEYTGTLYHTHASESRKEMREVQQRCGMDNVEYFNKIGILNEKTCLAHCIWLNEKEINLFIEKDIKVLHCPSSNLKLGSGIAKVPLFLNEDICVSLGADGAPCNNNLSMLLEMRLASLIQKPFSPRFMPAPKVFEMATMNGARALGKENEIGSIEVGKKCDLTFWDLERCWNPSILDNLNSVIAAIVYTANSENIKHVCIDGNIVYSNGEVKNYDEKEAVMKGKEELRKITSSIDFSA
jgi:5-methylthioadenosine/S-adenosylhomocysteine deaminase